MTVKLTWHGHSAFTLQIDSNYVLIDPFISGNPVAKVDAAELDADVILLSHAHGDHVSDVLDIAKRTGAMIVCNFEMGGWYENKGMKNVSAVNPGGSFRNSFLSAKWTVAHHSSSFSDGTYGGQPNGFIITIGDKKIYFAGDTSLFGDMRLIGEEGIHIAMLPVGDVFTMGIDDSIRAIKLIEPHKVVPMHYNTFPPIQQDINAWAERVKSETDATPVVLQVEEAYEI